MVNTRRAAKIVCTLGPATASPEGVASLVDAGMDVARLNFSHGTHGAHARAFAWVRAAAEAKGRAVAILADLQGPKIRLGTFPAGPVELVAGREFSITSEPVAGTPTLAATTYEHLARDVRPGDPILIDDGLVRLVVLSTMGPLVRCRVDEGGRISDHKGINLPGVAVSAPALTAKDEEDLRFALDLGVDLVALSFVRAASDVELVQRIMAECAIVRPVFAKIEKPEAVAHLAEIIDAFDGIMVARGDLGVEMALEQVPHVQKRAITMARTKAKPVIVATQMLESMVKNARPTRAEASDVANAVLDGADAVMLSAETSVGAHAITSVRTMSRIVREAEAHVGVGPPPIERGHSVSQAIAGAAGQLADDVGACAIVAFTESGGTARAIAAHRPQHPLLVFTPYADVCQQLATVWGLESFVLPPVLGTDAMISHVEHALVTLGRADPGDVFVVVAGTPPGTAGSTNTIRVHRAAALADWN